MLHPRQRIGRLRLVRSWLSGTKSKRYWLCVCSCGSSVTVRQDALTKENPTKSCGCLQKEYARTGKARRSHGQTYSGAWYSYYSMMKRCYDPKEKAYPDYGGRGITVCRKWRLSFENFYADMGDRPDNATLGRRDNDAGYTARNCFWATRTEQARNTRSTHWVEVFGERMSLADAVEKFGVVGYDTVKCRINRYKWEAEKALTTPVAG